MVDSMIAVVTDCMSDFSKEQIKTLSVQNSVCVFLPGQDDSVDSPDSNMRWYSQNTDSAVFQRYDIVIFCSQDGWNVFLPIMKKVCGVAIISSKSESFNEILRLVAFTFGNANEYNNNKGNLPKHLHWFDREVQEYANRLEEVGLLTDGVKTLFEEIYDIPLSDNWIKERNKN